MNKRIEALDVLRGITMVFMILVNCPGAGTVYAPLRHAPWNGMTPTDLVFPMFVFVMGVSMYLSFQKSGFKLSWKVLRRFVLLYGVGLLATWISGVVFRGEWGVAQLRLVGVLPRLALCYGATAVLVCTVNHKWLGWTAAGILAAYGVLLLVGSGFEKSAQNILARADTAIFTPDHLYKYSPVDPEGLLSTLPAIAHTLIGFLVGKLLVEKDFRKMDAVGTLLLTGGLLLQWGLPLNKAVWSPSFVLVSCGLGALLLSLLHYLIDEKSVWKHCGFWKVFGANAITCYLLSDVLIWIFGGSGLQATVMEAVGKTPFTSLMYAVSYVLIIYLIALPLYRKKIFIKL